MWIAPLRVEVGPGLKDAGRIFEVAHRASSSLLGPVDPSFRTLSGSLKFTVRRHNFNKDLPPHAACRPSGDATPCRMTGGTLHSHVRYKEMQARAGPSRQRLRL